MPFIVFLLLTLTFGLSACTTTIPRTRLPYPLTTDEFGEQVKLVSIPLPVIASSPNEGITYGALTAFLLHNRKDEVATLLAPQVNQNDNFGTTFSLYGAFYPTTEHAWEMNLSKSTRVNEDLEFKYAGKPFPNKKFDLNLFAYGLTDGSARFFGFQSGSQKGNETNYGDTEYGFTFLAGYQFLKHFQLVAGDRVRKVHIGPGAVSGLPFIRDSFSSEEVPGVDGFTAHAQKIGVVYSTLDSPTLPTFGGYARLSLETSFTGLGSSANYRHYEGELKGFIPIRQARYISVFRLVYNQTLGKDVPFLERSILGGENTLRGYGRNRFIDNTFFLLNLEERIRLFRWEIFDVTADWEVAPFIDFGAVVKSFNKVGSRNFEFNPGIGFRAVVRPNITGRVDIGFGKEGPAVFVGLGYPF